MRILHFFGSIAGHACLGCNQHRYEYFNYASVFIIMPAHMHIFIDHQSAQKSVLTINNNNIILLM